MKKKLLSVLGCLLIVADGIILAILLSQVPVGCSDAEEVTIGRKFYYGLPFPYYTAPGETGLGSLGALIKCFPLNAILLSVVVAFLSCIPSRKVNLKRIIAVLILNALVFGLLYSPIVTI